MATPHIAAEPGDFARVVLMPGDPLRAKFIAQNYLDDVRLVNSVRNMLGYTGTYEGVPVSVMGSGMGIPSMAIYSWELFDHFGVDTIIRIGSVGGLAPTVKVRDVVIAQATCTNSAFAQVLGLSGTIAPIADFGLLRRAAHAAEEMGVRYHVGNVLTTDTFYGALQTYPAWADMGILGVEMESAALYLNAAKAHRRALMIGTVSDLPLTGESLPAEERETSFTQMMDVALEVAVREYDGT